MQITALVAPTPPPTAAPAPEVRVLEIDGVINALTARYLSQGLTEAAVADASLVVVRLNTPGGLESSMREMTEALVASRRPVAVYVAPAGARAASAGMFITMAAHVAAMAPATNIGAAHPVAMGGQGDSVTAKKMENDAAALARAIARRRDRNASWAEQAVRKSVSITADEAREKDVIDLMVSDLDELIRRLDGWQVDSGGGQQTIHTADARIVRAPMSLPSRMLQAVTDPNVAYLLLSIGTIGIIAELYNPGMLFPGVIGAIALLVALLALGSLPINWVAALLLVIGISLFVADLHTEGAGPLSIVALIAFVLGSLMLYTPISPASPSMPRVHVSPWLVAGITAGILAFFLLVARALVRVHHAPAATGVEALVGRTGIAMSGLAPDGTVRLNTERWRAVVEGAPVRPGEEVEVIGVEGVTLHVRSAADRTRGQRREISRDRV